MRSPVRLGGAGVLLEVSAGSPLAQGEDQLLRQLYAGRAGCGRPWKLARVLAGARDVRQPSVALGGGPGPWLAHPGRVLRRSMTEFSGAWRRNLTGRPRP